MKKQINLGIVGLGEHMIRAHVKHLLAIEGVAVLRYFDPNPTCDISCFDSLKVKPLASTFEEIVADQRINAVLICSPDMYHLSQMNACVEANKHVMCDKPLIITDYEALALPEVLNEAQKRNLVISSCHPRRFDPPIVWLKSKLRDGYWKEANLGTVTDFQFDFWYHEVTDEWKKDRSLLKDHFGHEIDLYRFLFDREGQSSWEATLRFDSHEAYKVIGKNMNGSNIMPGFEFSGYRSLKESKYLEIITIKGTKGAMVMHLNEGKGFWMKDFKEFTFDKINYDERFRLTNENFIAAIRGEADPYLTMDDLLTNNISSVHLCKDGNYYHQP